MAARSGYAQRLFEGFRHALLNGGFQIFRKPRKESVLPNLDHGLPEQNIAYVAYLTLRVHVASGVFYLADFKFLGRNRVEAFPLRHWVTVAIEYANTKPLVPAAATNSSVFCRDTLHVLSLIQRSG